jgi:hypothetical protein
MLPTNIATHSNTLQIRANYDMMSVYLKHGNGGHNVNVGILNSRGGGSEAEKINVYRCSAYQEQAARSLQSQRNVADHACRPTAVSRCSEEHQSNRGKLNHLVFSVAHLRPTVSQALSRRRCSCYLAAIIASFRHELQRFTTKTNAMTGKWVAGGVWK